MKSIIPISVVDSERVLSRSKFQHQYAYGKLLHFNILHDKVTTPTQIPLRLMSKCSGKLGMYEILTNSSQKQGLKKTYDLSNLIFWL